MEKQLIVYVDGQCPMCVAGAERFRKFDKMNSLRFVNLHDPCWAAQDARRFSLAELNQEMRVQMPDGSWRSGYFAWASILENLPMWNLIGRVMLCPLLFGIGPAVYRWVAAHRLEISRLLRLPSPCDPNGVCRLGRE